MMQVERLLQKGVAWMGLGLHIKEALSRRREWYMRKEKWDCMPVIWRK